MLTSSPALAIRVGVVAGEPIRLEGLNSVFEREPEFGQSSLLPVIGSLDELLADQELEYLVIDLNSSPRGLETLKEIRRQRPALRLIVMESPGSLTYEIQDVPGIAAAARFLPLLAAEPAIARGYEVSIYPMCNPTGLAAGTRHACSGRDLNREFWLGSAEPEVVLLEREIRERRFDGLIALHADDETPGLYAFALGAQITEHVVEPALRAAERFLPRNCHPVIDNFTAQNGLIRKGYPGMLCAPPEQSPRPFEIVFETPAHADFELQVDANLVFLRTALDQYLQLQAVGQDL